MKRIAFIFALLVAIVPAKAQTTHTNCQVIGNQISCQSQTQTMPLPALDVRPPATVPLLTPEMAALIAERNRAAAEAMRQDVERFTAELSSHDAWVSLTTGNSYHVRMEGDRIYFFRIVPPGAYWSSNTDCGPSEVAGMWRCTNRANVYRGKKACSLESHGVLTNVSLRRLTGESDFWLWKDVDWGKCRIKKVERRPVTFIPRGSQQ